MISDKHKSIFVDVPKAAGQSINHTLENFNFIVDPNVKNHGQKPNIGRALQLKDKYNEVWPNYFKFCFMRNPWDRSVSSWKYLNRCSWNPTYKTFLEFLIAHPYKGQKDLIWHTSLQLDHIFDNNENSLVDFIGKFENLQEDFNVVCDKIGIPHQQLPYKNKSEHKHYTKYYDDETRQIVAEKYARDIEYFGYEFGE